jgi:hypothetical protein
MNIRQHVIKLIGFICSVSLISAQQRYINPVLVPMIARRIVRITPLYKYPMGAIKYWYPLEHMRMPYIGCHMKINL